MSSIGRLLTPATVVLWGDLDLSQWDYGDGKERPVVFDVEFSLQAGDKKVNSASMSFDPSPVGFRAYTQCIDKDHIDKPISIQFGYENGDFIEAVFFFQDVDFVTGSDQQIKVNLAGLHKQKLSSSWWSEYIGDGTKEFDLKELWDILAKKIDMEVVWNKEALEHLKDLPKMTQASIVREPIGTFMTRTANRHGLYLEYPTSSEGDHKKILVKTGALTAAVKENLKVEEQKAEGGKAKTGSERIDERKAFILGPTLVGTVNRKTNPTKSDTTSSPSAAYSIRTTAGQTDKGQLYGETNRQTSQDSGAKEPKESGDTLSSQATDNIDALTQRNKKRSERIASETEKVKNVQPVAVTTKIEQVVGEQGQNNPPGTSTPESKDTKQCIDKKTKKKLEGEALKKCLKKLEDAKRKKEINEYSQCSCEIFMVPYMVGVQPKDFIVFPSLNYEDPYIEDWEVKSVSYKQQGAAVVLSLEGLRPKPGADPLILEEDLKKLQDRVKSLLTVKDWQNYYWNN